MPVGRFCDDGPMTETADAAGQPTGDATGGPTPQAEAQPDPVQMTISVPGGDETAESIAAVVWGGGGGAVPPPDGVEERETADGDVRWVISWVDPPSPDRLRFLETALRRRGAAVVGTAAIAPDEGLDAWREHARVWPAGPFAVRPPWLDAPQNAGAIDLVIDPGSTFGSGSHQSTRMALELLAAQPLDGARVVDVGSGSGVLGIGAALLGAAWVELVELDPQGQNIGLTNAMRNEVADRVHWAGTDVAALARDRPGTPQDGPTVVLANMLIGELELVAPSLRALAGEGGRVIASGILESQVPRLLHAIGPHRRLDMATEPSETAASVSWVALAVELEPEALR